MSGGGVALVQGDKLEAFARRRWGVSVRRGHGAAWTCFAAVAPDPLYPRHAHPGEGAEFALEVGRLEHHLDRKPDLWRAAQVIRFSMPWSVRFRRGARRGLAHPTYAEVSYAPW